MKNGAACLQSYVKINGVVLVKKNMLWAVVICCYNVYICVCGETGDVNI